MEYIAVFIAILFPGALVALNNDLLQALPRFTVLRVYCAGIWHNAAVRCLLNGSNLLFLTVSTKKLYHSFALDKYSGHVTFFIFGVSSQ